jgi:endonuclease I
MHKLFFIFSIILFITDVSAQTEPSNNPTNLRFRNVRHWGATFVFNRSTADSFLVLKSDVAFTGTPIDGTIYSKGQWIGNGKVVSIGRSDSFFVKEMVENTTYHITAFAYNRVGTNTNYRQTNPLTGTVTTPASNPSVYYSSLIPGSPAFVSNLTTLVNSHTFVSYESYKFNIMPNIFERDTTNGNVTSFCAYSGVKTIYLYPITFGSGAGLYSKEHCLPRSWMLTGGNTSNPDGADFHNLLVTIYNEVNEKRSNYPYGNVVNTTYTYAGFKLGRDASNRIVAEPQNEYKGDAARAMMYQMISYNGQSGTWGLDNLSGLALQQDEATLKQWHNQDPPSKDDRTKNEYIFSLQFNRNPFIDNPGWVDCINFRNITYKACVAGLDNEEKPMIDYKWLSKTQLEVISVSSPSKDIQLYDLKGRLVKSQNTTDNSPLILDLSDLESSIYILSLNWNNKRVSVKIPYIN